MLLKIECIHHRGLEKVIVQNMYIVQKDYAPYQIQFYFNPTESVKKYILFINT